MYCLIAMNQKTNTSPKIIIRKKYLRDIAGLFIQSEKKSKSSLQLKKVY